MFPNVGDEVQLTEEYVNVDKTWSSLKGAKLDVLKIDLMAIKPNGPEYNIYFSHQGSIDAVAVDKYGASLDFGGGRVVVFQPWQGGFSPSKQKAASNDDCCKKCGTMGEVIGMACKCPNCGTTIWGI